MEDYGQSSQYVENESDGEQDNRRNSTDVIINQYLPLLMLPIISYMIIVYIHPVISFHLKHKTDDYFYMPQVGVNIDHDDEQKAKVEVAKKWKLTHLHCVLGANHLIYIIFFVRPLELIPLLFEILLLDKGVHSIDECIVDLNAILPGLVVTVLSFTALAAHSVKCIHRRISLISIGAMYISVNIIYMVCYTFPRMVVELAHDPLLATYMCFTAIGIVTSIYPLGWYCAGLLMLSRLTMKQAYVASFPFKSLFYFLISTVLVLTYLCLIFVVVLFGAIVITDNYSDHQYLRISYLLMGFLAIILFKPIHHCAYRHAIINPTLALNAFDPKSPWMNEEREEGEERNDSDSYMGANQDIVNWSMDNHYAELKEMKDDMQSDESTIV